MVSLQLENQQLQSNASLCEGRTASEWHGYPVDLQKGHEKLVKELLEKNIESDELRLLNQGLGRAHRTAVEALEALQLSHTAVLVDRDRLMSAGGSETHKSHNELAAINSNTIDGPSSRMTPPSSHTAPSTKPSEQSFMCAVRAELDISATPSSDVRGIQDGSTMRTMRSRTIHGSTMMIPRPGSHTQTTILTLMRILITPTAVRAFTT